MASDSINSLLVSYASLYGPDFNSLPAYAPGNPVDGEGGGSLGHSEPDASYDAAVGAGTPDVANGSGDGPGSDNSAAGNHGFIGGSNLYPALTAAGSTQAHATTDPGMVGNSTDSGSTFTSSAASPISYTYTRLDFPGSFRTTATSINATGKVAGNYMNVEFADRHGFIYNAGNYTTIDPPGSIYTEGNAINDAGEVAGIYVDNSDQAHGFLFDGTSYTTLDVPGSTGTGLGAINNAGEVAGTYTDSSDQINGFVYEGGSYTSIAFPGASATYAIDINNLGEVAGNYVASPTAHGFLYSAGSYTSFDFPGARATHIAAINDKGEVVGTYDNGQGVLDNSFVYSAGSYTTIDPPGSSVTFAYAINNTGEVAGVYADSSSSISHGFVYDGNSYTTIDFPDSINASITSINDAGEVAGEYEDSSGRWHAFTASPCYCRGTLILTERGEVVVEDLAIGDKVMTRSGGMRRIKWIGRRSYSGRFTLGQTEILPVCIKAQAIADGVPSRALWVSPHHAMYLEGVLIEARHLINGKSIVQAERVDQIEYFHIELDSHDVIVAESAFSETYIDDNNRGMFHNAHEYRVLYGGEPKRQAGYCAPRREEGFEVERARQAIAQRAGLPCAVEAIAVGALHGFVDNIGPGLIRGWAQHDDSPEAPVCLDIIASDKLLGQVLANRYRPDLADAGFGSGRHGFEFVPPSGLSFSPRSVTVRRSLDSAVLPPSGALAKQQNCGLRGYLDRVSRSRIEGWAEDETQPGAPLSLLILVNDVLVARVLANRYRPDLAAAGIGDGRHGFQFDLPEPLSSEERYIFRVRREADGVDLERSPAVLDPAPTDRAEDVFEPAQFSGGRRSPPFAENLGQRTEANACRRFEDRNRWPRARAPEAFAPAGHEPDLNALVIDDRLP